VYYQVARWAFIRHGQSCKVHELSGDAPALIASGFLFVVAASTTQEESNHFLGLCSAARMMFRTERERQR
jgi:hypothetical protein